MFTLSDCVVSRIPTKECHDSELARASSLWLRGDLALCALRRLQSIPPYHNYQRRAYGNAARIYTTSRLRGNDSDPPQSVQSTLRVDMRMRNTSGCDPACSTNV
jgi:hypothetical protein